MGERKSTNEVRHPQDATVGHDLDPNADGDLTRVVNVENSEALVIGTTSQDGEALSVSLRWIAEDPDTDQFVTWLTSYANLNGRDAAEEIADQYPSIMITLGTNNSLQIEVEQ